MNITNEILVPHIETFGKSFVFRKNEADIIKS